MKLRTKNRFALTLWMVGGLPLLYLAASVSEWFFVVILLFMAGIGYYSMNLRCPVCRKPLIYNPVNWLFLIDIWCWTPWIPRQCTKCGTNID